MFKKIILVVFLFSLVVPANAYYHCYSDKCQITRLEDKVKRLTKKLNKTTDEIATKKIDLEIEAAEYELKQLRETVAKN